MYDIIYDVPTTGVDYVKDGVLHRGSTGGGVIVESESDLDNLPTYRPGSLAHTPGYQQVWEADTDGAWVSIK